MLFIHLCFCVVLLELCMPTFNYGPVIRFNLKICCLRLFVVFYILGGGGDIVLHMCSNFHGHLC